MLILQKKKLYFLRYFYVKYYPKYIVEIFNDMIKQLCFTACIVVFLWGISISAQTGPGGVGSSASNVMWFKAEDLSSLSDGDNITSWIDASGNGNDLTQPNTSFTPVYKTSILNGFPAVRFEKLNGRLRRTGFTTFPTSAITAIYVNKNAGENNDGVLSYASSASNNDFLLFSSNNLMYSLFTITGIWWKYLQMESVKCSY
jgi:hypothetical protein